MRITPHDIGTFRVESRTRRGEHMVDVLEWTCSCEGYAFYQTCHHIQETRRRLLRHTLFMIVAMKARR